MDRSNDKEKDKKTKTKAALAIAGTVLMPALAGWVGFSGRELILPGSALVGVTLAILIGLVAAVVFIVSVNYFFKERNEN